MSSSGSIDPRCSRPEKSRPEDMVLKGVLLHSFVANFSKSGPSGSILFATDGSGRVLG